MRTPKSILYTLIFLELIAFHLSAQVLFTENFDYPAGDTLWNHGWGQTGSSTATPIMITEPGLTFQGFPGGSGGNAATLKSSGQDLHHLLADTVRTGRIYAFLLVRVITAKSGDYFFHLLQPPVGSNIFAGKISVRLAENGRLAFGIAKRSNIPTFTDSTYSTETTYLLVLKYSLNSETTVDDQASLYVFSSESPPPIVEPAAATAGPVSDSLPDAEDLCLVGLRQGTASVAPTLFIDGIRIATTWDAALPIKLAFLNARRIGVSDVSIEWGTLCEAGGYGFVVQRRFGMRGSFDDVSALIPGRGTAEGLFTYSFIDHGAPPGRIPYRLKELGADGMVSFSDSCVAGEHFPAPWPVSGKPGLLQNYPNPCNASTSIWFRPANRGEASLRVFNVLGEEVATLFSGIVEAGRVYTVQFDATGISSGVYLCRLSNGDGDECAMVVVLR
jgi:hypothetical protein